MSPLVLAFLCCLSIVSQVIAVDFVFPNNDAKWTTSGPNNISWTYLAFAPQFSSFQLLHNGDATFQPIPGLLPSNGIFLIGVDLQKETLAFTPSCMPGNPSLPPGSGYSLRMFTETANGTQTTLGTSNGTFNIVAGPPTIMCLDQGNGTSSSSGISGPTRTAAASNLSSSSPKNRAGAIAAGVGGALIMLIGAGVVVFNKHRRELRKRLTQQFVMKKRLNIGTTVDKTDLEINERAGGDGL